MPQNEKVGGVSVDAEIDLSKIDNSGKKLEASLNKLEGGLKKTKKGLDETEQAAHKAGGAFDGLFKRFAAANIVGNIVTSAFSRISAGVSQFLKGIIKATSDLTELDSKARVVFGTSFPAISQQARAIGAEVGRASSTILQFATDMGAIISSFGIAGPLLEQMSTQFAQLAVDMASFMNTTDEEAFSALRSGITGETEPLKRFGIVLTDANLQLFAFEKGIKTKILAMNQAQKTALRYAFIMEKTSLAQGDAARTADSYANQTRRLAGEVKTLQEQLGKSVTPGLATGLGVVSAAIQNVRIFVSLLSQDISSLFDLLSISVPGAGAIGKVLTATINRIPKIRAIRAIGSAIGSTVGTRVDAVKKQELAGEKPSPIDPLANFNSLGGKTPGQDGGAEAKKLADDLKKAEDEFIKALGDEADANKENLDLRRNELMLRQKLGFLTDRESRELAQINRRLDYKIDAINDATRAWEDQHSVVENLKKEIEGINDDIKKQAQELNKTFADIDREAQKKKNDKAADLVKERAELLAKMNANLGSGLSGDESRRLGEINTILSGQSIGTQSAGESLGNMNDFQRIDADAAEQKKEAAAESNRKLEESVTSLSIKQAELNAAQEMETKAIEGIMAAQDALRVVTDANFKAIEERTTLHVNQQIAELNRLRAALGSNSAPIPGFAGGGAVFGPGTATSDSIVARLSHGEHVLDAADVRAMGGHAAVMEFRRNLPRFSEGGPVTQHNEKSANITINNHGHAAKVYADPRRARWDARIYPFFR